MSIIVFHKNILAADSRSSRHPDTLDATCPECSHTFKPSFRDNQQKIKLVKHRAVFRGEQILAFAGAGPRDFIVAAQQLLTVFPDYFEKLGTHFEMANLPSTTTDFILVTTKSVFKLVVPATHNKKLLVTSYDRKSDFAPVMTGCGEKAAKASFMLTNNGPIGAVGAAIGVDPRCGGKINYVKFNDAGGESFADLKIERLTWKQKYNG